MLFCLGTKQCQLKSRIFFFPRRKWSGVSQQAPEAIPAESSVDSSGSFDIPVEKAPFGNWVEAKLFPRKQRNRKEGMNRRDARSRHNSWRNIRRSSCHPKFVIGTLPALPFLFQTRLLELGICLCACFGASQTVRPVRSDEV